MPHASRWLSVLVPLGLVASQLSGIGPAARAQSPAAPATASGVSFGRQLVTSDSVNMAALSRQEARRPGSPSPSPASHPRRPLPRRPPAAHTVQGAAGNPPSSPGARPQAASVRTAQPAAIPAVAPLTSFDAVDDDNTVIPPDTNGAVGPNHVMTALNNTVRIQDRTGTTVSSVSLNSFWSGSFTTEVFDPRLVYDPVAGRWIFAVTSDAASANSAMLLAVSQTSDPTGTWNRHKLLVDGTGANFGDYTALGFNHKWVVVTVNLFTIANQSPAGSKIAAFDRAGLYAGATPLSVGVHVDPNGFTEVPALTYDDTLTSLNLVEEWIGPQQKLRISTISGPVGTEVFSTNIFATVPLSPWAEATPLVNGGFAPQSGSAGLIDAGDARMQSVVYRGGSLWVASTVFLPAAAPTRSSVQWTQMTTLGAVTQAARVDDPAGAQFYAYPSLAVNAAGDMGLGYSHFSAAQFASADYASRAAIDPINTLRAPTVVKAGLAKYNKIDSANFNRWGDYSATVVDPVGDSAFWTIQEYAAAPVPATTPPDRWGTWWAKFAAPDRAATTLVAAVGGDNALYYRIGNQSYQGLGGILIAAPAVVSVPAPGVAATVPYFIGLGTDHRYYVRGLSATWQDLLPGIPVGCYDNPGAAVSGGPTYTLTVTCVGGDRALYYWQIPVTSSALPSIPASAPAHALGGALLSGAAVAQINGTVTFFAEGTDHIIYSTIGGGYTPIQAACNGHPAVATLTPSSPDALFACQGTDGALYFSKNTGGAGWDTFHSAGGLLIDGPGIAYMATGPVIFAEGRDRAVYHTTVSPAGTSSNGFTGDGGGVVYGVAATAV